MKKKFVRILLAALLVFMLAACGNQGTSDPEIPQEEVTSSVSTAAPEPENGQTSQDASDLYEKVPADIDASKEITDRPVSEQSDIVSSANPPAQNKNETVPSDERKETPSAPKALVAYFSRAGENYGVGVVEKGNTEIIADMILSEIEADSFRIQTVNAYPESYDECTDIAKQERDQGARPELASTIANFADYDVIYLGYPIWYGDMPMAVYTFLESYDFSGKTIVPFCTHAGSGLAGTVSSIQSACSGATVMDGLAIAGTTAQSDRDAAKRLVENWLGQ